MFNRSQINLKPHMIQFSLNWSHSDIYILAEILSKIINLFNIQLFVSLRNVGTQGWGIPRKTYQPETYRYSIWPKIRFFFIPECDVSSRPINGDFLSGNERMGSWSHILHYLRDRFFKKLEIWFDQKKIVLNELFRSNQSLNTT